PCPGGRVDGLSVIQAVVHRSQSRSKTPPSIGGGSCGVSLWTVRTSARRPTRQRTRSAAKSADRPSVRRDEDPRSFTSGQWRWSTSYRPVSARRQENHCTSRIGSSDRCNRLRYGLVPNPGGDAEDRTRKVVLVWPSRSTQHRLRTGGSRG